MVAWIAPPPAAPRRPGAEAGRAEAGRAEVGSVSAWSRI